eukprot:gnl/MRDRNA2_/MRDRNA2_113118_c0_seq1.p1 gnl/MRDRNA2_/MRDRNA2_113118_c0~~gnl/MRDRNA2_/MRDRNA2_113118_c0_seq1.p1  ORF type:complete len:689 (-),score=109.09 gnl/MRDRNA2_/MRDRNA2_113118_c0_seq1:184-2250(-)
MHLFKIKLLQILSLSGNFWAVALPAAWTDVKAHIDEISEAKSCSPDMKQRLNSKVRWLAWDDVLAMGKHALDLPEQDFRGVAHFLEEVAMHPNCLRELDPAVKGACQARCPDMWFKISVQKVLAAEDAKVEEAEAIWNRAVHETVGPDGEQRIRWRSWVETPTLFLPALQSKPFWDCTKHWPFVAQLEANANVILAEAKAAAPHLDKAYPYLTPKGSWQNLFLYRKGRWNLECEAMPQTCNLLKAQMPTKPEVPFAVGNSEEIVLFHSKPGAVVGKHCGATNAQLNIHLTLSGGKGTYLEVGDHAPMQLTDGKAVCFQDSFQHGVDHKSGEDRISLVLRVQHPEMQMETFGNCERTDVTDLRTWDGTKAREKADRVLKVYRDLGTLKANHSNDDHACNALFPVPPHHLQQTQVLHEFLSQSDELPSRADAIFVACNWYDRVGKVRRILELAARYPEAPIFVAGGIGRLSSLRAQELDGEAKATAELLRLGLGNVAMAIPPERVHSVGCQDCSSEELRHRCGCVGNTGFNVDRFLDWAEENIKPGAQVIVVEESFLARRTYATLAGRLSGFQRSKAPSVSLNISMDVVGTFENLRAVHKHSPHAVASLVATEVLRLQKYSQPDAELRLFHQIDFLGSQSGRWLELLKIAETLDAETKDIVEPLKGSSARFRHCLQPRVAQAAVDEPVTV